MPVKATKKLPVPINPKTGRPRAGSDFLVPFPMAGESSGFIGIQSGKRHASGMLVFLGIPVTAQDIRIRAAKFSSALSALTDEQLDAYLDALSQFKIGNVVAIAYAADGTFTVSKMAEMCPPSNPSKLP